MKTVRQHLTEMLKLVPEDKLDLEVPGFVLILPFQEYPVTLSNLSPQLSEKLIRITAEGELDLSMTETSEEATQH